MKRDINKSISTNFTQKDVEKYYDEQSIIYNFNSKNSFHYGMWYSETKNSQKAQDNLNKLYGEKLNLNNKDIVLDAGCGIGGPAIFMAENYGVNITGITLSNHQVHTARSMAEKSPKKDQIQFYQQDYTKTSFEDSYFTKMYAMESSCHAVQKISFIKEAHRVLKKGGKLIVTDVFLIKRDLSEKEISFVQTSVKGMCLPNIAFFDDFENDLKKVGFNVLEKYDLTKISEKSIRNIWINAMLIYPITKILSLLKWIPQNFHDTILVGLSQQKLAKYKIAIIGGFLVEK